MCTTQWENVSRKVTNFQLIHTLTVSQSIRFICVKPSHFSQEVFMVTIVYFHIDNEQHRVNKVAQIAIQSEQRSQLANYFC